MRAKKLKEFSSGLSKPNKDSAREHTLEQDAASALATLEEEAGALNTANANANEELLRAEASAANARETLGQREHSSESLAAELAEINARSSSLENTRQENAEAVARADTQLESLSPQQLEAESEIAAAPGVLMAEAAVSDARRKVSEAREVFEQASAIQGSRDGGGSQCAPAFRGG